MRMWMFVCAVVAALGFSADSAIAQEPVQAPAKAITSSDPAPVVQERTGLFRGRRFRSERVNVIQTPTVTTPSTPSTTAPTPTPTTGTVETGPFQRQGLLARLRARR